MIQRTRIVKQWFKGHEISISHIEWKLQSQIWEGCAGEHFTLLCPTILNIMQICTEIKQLPANAK